jgi:phage terminase small subunit
MTRRLSDASTAAPAHLPPPDGLAPDAALIWDRLAPLVPAGKLNPATGDLFAMLCTQLATFWEADKLVQETGILTVDGLAITVNPAVAIRDRADGMTMRWAKVFGLMPDQPQAAPQRPGMRHLREA